MSDPKRHPFDDLDGSRAHCRDALMRDAYERRRLAWRQVFEAWFALPVSERVREVGS